MHEVKSFKFPKTLYFAISDPTAIPENRPADFEKVGATATIAWGQAYLPNSP